MDAISPRARVFGLPTRSEYTKGIPQRPGDRNGLIGFAELVLEGLRQDINVESESLTPKSLCICPRVRNTPRGTSSSPVVKAHIAAIFMSLTKGIEPIATTRRDRMQSVDARLQARGVLCLASIAERLVFDGILCLGFAKVEGRSPQCTIAAKRHTFRAVPNLTVESAQTL